MNRRLKTEKVRDTDLDKIIMVAAQQKMLPQLIWDYSKRNNSQNMMAKYQKSIKKLYTQQTSHVLHYNQQQARSHRQKFRQKVLKLVANQLPIDYLKPTKTNNNSYIMTYKGHPLQDIKYKTKKQYRMFQDFSENKFKKDYNQIFDDRLEYHHQKMFREVKKQEKDRKSVGDSEKKNSGLLLDGNGNCGSDKKEVGRQKVVSLPKLIMGNDLFNHKNHITPLSSVRKKKPNKINTTNQTSTITEKMRLIGGYSKNTEIKELSLTKQSINRYLKQYYIKPQRIIDFLSISPVENYQNYLKIPQKLKLMPNQHIYFMTFMFYDRNNDGYICHQDLLKIAQISKKCPLIKQDWLLLTKNGLKVKYQDKLDYKELYSMIDLSETSYFNWRQTKIDNPQEITLEKSELKDFFGNLNKKKILIHFDGFKKLFKNQKPFLWYDLLWRLGGITFEGLKYQ